MDPAIAREKMRQAKEALSASAFDCWLLLTREGSDPAAAFLTGASTVGLSAFLLYRDGTDEAIVANFDLGHVSSTGVMQSVEAYERGLREPLVARLRARGVRRIALDYALDDALGDGLTHGLYLWFSGEEEAPWTCGSAAELLSAVRGVKVDAEVSRLRRACETTVEIYDRVRRKIRSGQSEREIARLFVLELKARGLLSGTADTFEGPLVLIPRIGMSHRNPTDARLEPGDMLVVDLSVVVEGYASDIARTFYCPRPGETSAPDEVQRMFRASRGAIEAAVAALVPGRLGYQVDRAARDALAAAGYPDQPIHAVGHQVGQRPHDGGMLLAPLWDRYGDGPRGAVRSGMVFAIEPTVLPGGSCAVLTEENVVVRSDGCERLHDWQQDIWLVQS